MMRSAFIQISIAAAALWLGFLCLTNRDEGASWNQSGYNVARATETADDRMIVVSCVGDSITAGGGASAPNMTYVSQLSRALGAGFNVTGYGVSSTTMLKHGLCSKDTTHCEGLCAYWNTTAYQRVIASQPDVITIMLGTNDAKGCNWWGPPNGSPSGVAYHAAYVDMVKIFQSLPSKPRVYLVIPPPLVNPPTHPDDPPVWNMSKQVLNEIIPKELPKLLVETGAAGVIDVWTALGGTDGYEQPSMTADGCHPKDPAAAIIAQAIAEAIQKDQGGKTAAD
ncbi:lipolytic protein G-D-S-L family [Seminavis robusta]|uniref:Lipolytic protein G-D-S-L family n=1 Tax=Seminavis robusta TaxID=568900 RepID=A0A9N8DFV7_9STRA|nr:lipolytic protein G-D-S-L family [Seminavis robusta]|eukprot:Sro130_g062060.1 lipolytic protein G-D-S-L family (281) ;mRNA; f:96425-97267